MYVYSLLSSVTNILHTLSLLQTDTISYTVDIVCYSLFYEKEKLRL